MTDRDKLIEAERPSLGRVVHCKREPYDVLIDRRTEFGNPHKMHSEKDRDEIIRQFEKTARARLTVDFRWADKVKALHGKTLGCWCSPKPCHGDILLKLAAELQEAK